jgi:uncharacterized repeat protein (TIGR02543 family)
MLKTLLTVLTTLTLFSIGLPPAVAANYSVSYNANSNMVGAVSQAGVVTGSLPSTISYAQGSVITVSAVGDLARQGFTFAGWNDRSDGTGVTYAAGSGTFTLGAANVVLYAKWTVPNAARLIGNGGSLITVTNPNNVANSSVCLGKGIRGITSNGTNIFYRPSQTSGNSGYICEATPTGTLVSVNSVTGLSAIAADSNALVYGSGCLFIRKDPNTTFNSIYCIALGNWTLTSISLPVGYSMPGGSTWLYGNFIQFPDGRIGSVGTAVTAASWPGGVGTGAGQCPSGMTCKKLRIYNVLGSGETVTTTFSTDFILVDTVTGWPSDDHGIATDGTYLYQVRHARGYKVWALQGNGPSYLVFNGDADGTATTPACGASTGITATYCQITYPVTGASAGGAMSNSTYMGRAHGLGKYLLGDYDGAGVFWLSDPATPPPGPGNPDITPPSFTNSDTFTVTENIATSFNAATITVNDSATLTLGAGIDGALFNILLVDTASSYIRFKASPDFEGPTDVGTNNIYNFTITTTDSVGNSASKTFAIVVTNVSEASTTTPPAITGTAYKGVITTLTVTVNAPGKVRFYLSGKRIPGCLARATSGNYPNYTATCSWKPPVMGLQKLTAELTPSDNTFSTSTSAVGSFWVLRRSTAR